MAAKSKVKQSFAEAATSYDNVALLQRKVGRNLLQRMEKTKQADTVVDLGCGTGFLIHELLAQKTTLTEKIIALDIALPMLQIARNKTQDSDKITYLCADAELLPIQPQSVDLVLSNLALQWCGNLDKALGDVKRILKPGGSFMFTTFGFSTLHELKSAWQEVDHYTHVNSFFSKEQLAGLLNQSGFGQVELHTERYISIYESVWDLMAELKQLGAHTVMEGCNKRLTTKAKMQRMISAYQKQDENGLVPATFEVITTSAKA